MLVLTGAEISFGLATRRIPQLAALVDVLRGRHSGQIGT